MVTAIILSGGKGKRMGANISKQFININGKPILYYTLLKFIESSLIDRVALVLPKEEVDYCKREVLDKYNLKVDFIVEGGKERQESVYNALKAIKNTEIVLIHDGARPFVSEQIIQKGIKSAKKYFAAAPGVTPKDTIKIRDDKSFSIETPNRNVLVAVQTPQCFKYELIMECHEKVRQSGIAVTDDTMVAELYNHKVFLYEGDYTNIKVTTPEDLVMAEFLAKSQFNIDTYLEKKI